MKVFTVGLDQKPPIKDTESGAAPEKGGSPPPGYVPQPQKHIPLPMGPELPQPIHVMQRKSRGYKGILMVMLSVFLMALFALTLSEIAYNRQRDENFFRLRWAELKHRLGYAGNGNGAGAGEFDYYHRPQPDRFFSLTRNKEMSEALMQQSESTTTTSMPPPSTSEPVMIADSFPPKPSMQDARLQFLKTILQKIKQHAEDMGFDGTMQVSVIEVEPQMQNEDASSSSSSFMRPRAGQQHPLMPNFFPHLPIEEQQPGPKVGSDSFLDGFGEYHQPSFMQNNQLGMEQRPAFPLPNEEQQQQQNGGDFASVHWPRAPLRPDPMMQQQQQWGAFPPHMAGLPARPFDRWSNGQQQNMMGEDQQLPGEQSPFKPSNGGVDSSSSGSSSSNPSQEVVGEIYGRKFGRMLQDIIANRIHGFHALQQQFQNNPLMMPPSAAIQQQNNQEAHPPMFPQQQGQQQQQQWWQQPQGGEEAKNGAFPPPPVIFFPMNQGGQQQQAFPSFGKEMMNRNAPFKNFIPPEDRIQVEPPSQTNLLPNQPLVPQRPSTSIISSSSSEEPVVKTLVDNNSAPSAPRGWTHQLPSAPQQSSEEPKETNPQQNQPAETQNNGNASQEEGRENKEDVWLTGPPHRTQMMVDASTSQDSSAAAAGPAPSVVDFPAVKFPNNNEAKPAAVAAAPAAEPLSNVQNDQPSVHSNPVFFQVDDPTSMEQQQSNAAAAPA